AGAVEQVQAGRSKAGLPRERLWRIRAGSIVVATGAIERPMVFPDNDRPGVMLASAVQRYLNQFGVACGRRAVIYADNDHAQELAGELEAAGVGIAAMIVARQGDATSTDPMQGSNYTVLSGHVITGVEGRKTVHGVRVAPLKDGVVGVERTIECDLVCVSGGWNPTVHLFSQAGGSLDWDAVGHCFVPRAPLTNAIAIGAAAGVFDLAQAFAHARESGRRIARSDPPVAIPCVAAAVGANGEPPPLRVSVPRSGLRRPHRKQFVDLQNDIAVSDVALAARENYRSVEHLKRYTTTGMGTDQGKTSNLNALALLGEFTGKLPAKVGTTKFRPPYSPQSLGAIAANQTGELYRPLRRMPGHAWHVAQGAALEDYGGWLRPAAYPQS
ncbi:MAG: sarcosine oxidase subunit alpha family protein, partial [Methylocella sp.]